MDVTLYLYCQLDERTKPRSCHLERKIELNEQKETTGMIVCPVCLSTTIGERRGRGDALVSSLDRGGSWAVTSAVRQTVHAVADGLFLM